MIFLFISNVFLTLVPSRSLTRNQSDTPFKPFKLGFSILIFSIFPSRKRPYIKPNDLQRASPGRTVFCSKARHVSKWTRTLRSRFHTFKGSAVRRSGGRQEVRRLFCFCSICDTSRPQSILASHGRTGPSGARLRAGLHGLRLERGHGLSRGPCARSADWRSGLAEARGDALAWSHEVV